MKKLLWIGVVTLAVTGLFGSVSAQPVAVVVPMPKSVAECQNPSEPGCNDRTDLALRLAPADECHNPTEPGCDPWLLN